MWMAQFHTFKKLLPVRTLQRESKPPRCFDNSERKDSVRTPSLITREVRSRRNVPIRAATVTEHGAPPRSLTRRSCAQSASRQTRYDCKKHAFLETDSGRPGGVARGGRTCGGFRARRSPH